MRSLRDEDVVDVFVRFRHLKVLDPILVLAVVLHQRGVLLHCLLRGSALAFLLLLDLLVKRDDVLVVLNVIRDIRQLLARSHGLRWFVIWQGNVSTKEVACGLSASERQSQKPFLKMADSEANIVGNESTRGRHDGLGWASHLKLEGTRCGGVL